MALQGIPRDNGENIVGYYDIVVSQSETDCDTMGPDGHVPTGRFRHSMELYFGRRASIVSRTDRLVVVIELHDEANGSYREAEELPDRELLLKFVSEYDPTKLLPADGLSAEVAAQVAERYKRRAERFIEMIKDRVPPPPTNP